MRKVLLASLFVTACAVFVSCSDDDDEGGSIPTGPVATYAGNLVKKAGPYTFYYDENGRCSKIESNGYDGAGEFDYSKGTYTLDDDDQVYKVTFNGKGYITKLSTSWNYPDYDGNDYTGNGTLSFSYDGDGHLIGCTINGTETVVNDEGSEKYNETGKGVMTWVNGNLMKTSKVYDAVWGGEKYKNTYDCEFEYGNQRNVTGQYCSTLIDGISMELDALALVGMFGTASAYLPVKCSTSELFEGDLYENTKYPTFTLNSDGTIDSENNWGRWNYSYTSVGEGASYMPRSNKAKALSSVEKAKKARSLFIHHDRRK